MKGIGAGTCCSSVNTDHDVANHCLSLGAVRGKRTGLKRIILTKPVFFRKFLISL